MARITGLSIPCLMYWILSKNGIILLFIKGHALTIILLDSSFVKPGLPQAAS